MREEGKRRTQDGMMKRRRMMMLEGFLEYELPYLSRVNRLQIWGIYPGNIRIITKSADLPRGNARTIHDAGLAAGRKKGGIGALFQRHISIVIHNLVLPSSGP